MAIASVNPANGETLTTFEKLSEKEIDGRLESAHQAQLAWRHTPLEKRTELMLNMARIYRENKEELGKVATLEMGKPLKQAIAEVEKCAWAMDYYAENTEKHLEPIYIKTDNEESYVRFDPMGVILAVMPWNFPYWQVIRAIAPALMAGNGLVLKHASNVPQVALKIQELVEQAGFPKGLMQTLLIESGQVEAVINDERIIGVALTGSEYAGSKVAEAAGRNIKPSVLELGGSDPFIVLEDADLDYTIEQAVIGRLQNNGQSCIAAKRFIIHESTADEFVSKFKTKFEEFVVGDPMDEKTQLGPVVNEQAIKDLDDLVSNASDLGAEIVTGGKKLDREGCFYAPTIIDEITESMDLYREEAFGPVASIYRFSTIEQAVEIANTTRFGLGASIWTKNTKKAEELAARIDSGSVFINKIVSSDPRLPFGGTKKSGYGRELSHFGMWEFMNIKTVVVAQA